MRITIEALGTFRGLLPEGADSTTIELPEGGTLDDALRAFGVVPDQRWNAAIEGQLVNSDRVLRDGERLLVFAPISGGRRHR